MAYNFNNDPFFPYGQAGRGLMSPSPTQASGDTPETPGTSPAPDAPQSAAFARFRSCRWQQPKEESGNEFCTHREVKPYAGTNGFDADAWCTECQYYKLRRAPKKRQPGDDYSY